MINPAPMRANGTKTHVPNASSSSDSLNADRGDLLIRTFRGIDGRNVRFRRQSMSQEAYKVACRRMGETLSNSKGFQ